MPSAPIKRTPFGVQAGEKNSRQAIPPQQFVPEKSPQPEDLADTNLKRTSDTLDDVSFLRLPDVKRLTGLSKSTLYALIRSKSFPAPVRLGPRTVAWVRSEVKEWAAERISTSRSAASHLNGGRMPQRTVGEAWSSSKKSA